MGDAKICHFQFPPVVKKCVLPREKLRTTTDTKSKRMMHQASQMMISDDLRSSPMMTMMMFY